MKRELIEALEKVERAYRLLADNPNLVAPQFKGETQAHLAVVIMHLTKALDACVESEQLNGGLN